MRRAPTPPPTTSAPGSDRRGIPRKRILAIDDAQHILDVVLYVLEENAFSAVTALSTAEGLGSSKKTLPALSCQT